MLYGLDDNVRIYGENWVSVNETMVLQLCVDEMKCIGPAVSLSAIDILSGKRWKKYDFLWLLTVSIKHDL